ncbi:MAG: DNA recombination protein RmuC [Candidatus Saccharibacteria bacterium]|nr:DNA recombination protein RmuC [Candidatus Saccharibacteria bacterium]
MEIAIVVLGLVVVVLLAVLIKKSTSQADQGSTMMLKQDLTTLSENVQQLKEGLHTQLNDRLDKSSQQMARQYEQSAGIIKDVTEKLTALEKTNQQVGDIAGELKVLQNVLTNPKQRGGVGEYYLQTVLENVMAPSQFKLQYAFKDGEIVDAAIFIDKKILTVDSKFSLENYNRLIDEKDKSKREAIVRSFKADLKNRIDETAKYIRPSEDTMDFAFMFIPSEAIYYDLLINKIGASGTNARDLLEYAFREKSVIIVSPTTFMAYLQTVLQGLRSLQIEEQAKDIQQRVGDLGRHIGAYDTFMQKLGNSLGTTVNHYNTAHKELKKIDKDVVKIAEVSPSVEPLLIDKPKQDEEL